MQVDHDTGRTGFLDGLQALRAVADGLDDDQLLAPSRCRGWTAGDVLVHVHLGLQEMLLGVVSPPTAHRTPTPRATGARAAPIPGRALWDTSGSSG
jgi:hypothetical protein